MLKSLLALLLFDCALSARATPDPALVQQLADKDSSAKAAAIQKLTQTGDPDTVRILQAMADYALVLAGGKVLVVDGDKAFDAATGAPVKAPENSESITVNNRIRGELVSAMAALKLFDAAPAARLDSAQKLQSKVSADMAPLLAKALGKESDARIKALLSLAHAQANLANTNPAACLAAVRALSGSSSPSVKSLLPLTDKAGEADTKVHYAATSAVKAIDGRLSMTEDLGRVFSDLSLGSILLLGALVGVVIERAVIRWCSAARCLVLIGRCGSRLSPG